MSFEKKFFLKNKPFLLIASDEAGRGPLAGPVVAASVAVKVSDAAEVSRLCQQLRQLGVGDSKAFREVQRQAVLEELGWSSGAKNNKPELLQRGLMGAYCQSSPAEIDQINILQASLKCMLKSAQCVSSLENLPVVWLIDGNRAPRNVSQDWSVHPIIKGDVHSSLIGLASFIAKVTRDRLMQKYDTLYPYYGFKNHMGYGTKKHREAIAEYGLTPIHRQTFRGVKEFISRPES